ncbi:hypothetical protein SynSYN20_02683 [Synechococcus sp. SYN20]|nr:hypothetical protein SynSYN20_02683 [Synechococcus sp. SYN20]
MFRINDLEIHNFTPLSQNTLKNIQPKSQFKPLNRANLQCFRYFKGFAE